MLFKKNFELILYNKKYKFKKQNVYNLNKKNYKIYIII